MENVYYYHSYFKIIEKKLPRVALTLIVLCWLPTIWVYVAIYHDFYFPLLRLSLNGSMMVVFIILLLGMALRELTKTTFVINEDAFIKKTPFKIKIAYFDEITAFKHIRFSFLNGFGKIEYPGGSIRLPFIIQNLSQCIIDIEKQLESRGKNRVYNQDSIQTFKQIALISDFCIVQASAAFSILSRISLWLMFAGGLIARYFWSLPFRWVIVWSLCGFIFPYAGFLISQWHIARKLKRVMDKKNIVIPAIDTLPTYRLFGLGILLLYFLAGILLKKLALFPN